MNTTTFEFFPFDFKKMTENFKENNSTENKSNENKSNENKSNENKSNENTKKTSKFIKFWRKWGNLILFGLLIFIVPSLLILSLKHPTIKKHFINFILYFRNTKSFKTYSLFIIFIVLMSLIISNTTIPNLMSGMIFGLAKGSILTTIGIIISGMISFLISRYMIKERIRDMIKTNPLIEKYYNMIIKSEEKFSNKNYLEIILLSRLAPISPYHTFSFFWGISNVKLWVYLIGSLGVLPSLLFETYIGSQFENIDELFTHKTKIFHIIIIVIISVIIGWIVEKRINKIIEKKENKLKQNNTRSSPSHI